MQNAECFSLNEKAVKYYIVILDWFLIIVFFSPFYLYSPLGTSTKRVSKWNHNRVQNSLEGQK